MEYRIDFLDVGDADAIVISYREDENSSRKIALIDAGNVGDAERIKNFIYATYNTNHINYAICTHPDKDHKGGFSTCLKIRMSK